MNGASRGELLQAGSVLVSGVALGEVLPRTALDLAPGASRLPARDPLIDLLSRVTVGLSADDTAAAGALGFAAWLER